MKKTAVERSLAALVQKGSVTKKEYGKTKLFLLTQSSIELPDPEEAAQIDDRLKQLGKELEECQGQLSAYSQKENALRATLTLEEAKTKCENLSNVLAEKQKKLEALGDPSKLISNEDKLQVEKNYYDARNAWKKRKRIVKNIVDQISEAMAKKPKELVEQIGIETDEEVNIDIAQFPEIQNPSKPHRLPLRPIKRLRQQ